MIGIAPNFAVKLRHTWETLFFWLGQKRSILPYFANWAFPAHVGMLLYQWGAADFYLAPKCPQESILSWYDMGFWSLGSKIPFPAINVADAWKNFQTNDISSDTGIFPGVAPMAFDSDMVGAYHNFFLAQNNERGSFNRHLKSKKRKKRQNFGRKSHLLRVWRTESHETLQLVFTGLREYYNFRWVENEQFYPILQIVRALISSECFYSDDKLRTFDQQQKCPEESIFS